MRISDIVLRRRKIMSIKKRFMGKVRKAEVKMGGWLKRRRGLLEI